MYDYRLAYAAGDTVPVNYVAPLEEFLQPLGLARFAGALAAAGVRWPSDFARLTVADFALCGLGVEQVATIHEHLRRQGSTSRRTPIAYQQTIATLPARTTRSAMHDTGFFV